MKKWPVIQQIRNFLLLHREPKTRHIAWPYIKSYAAYAVVVLISIPVLFPLYLVGIGMRNAGDWVLDTFHIPGIDKLLENYERCHREAYEAYAPYQNKEGK